MTARTTMAALIDQTRTLINDPSGAVLADDDVQNALDRLRIEQRHVPLTPSPTFQAGGAVLYLDFYANVGFWEDDVVLQDVSYTTVTASLAEPIVGHWHFTTQPGGFAVRATGKTYDLYGSAADLLEAYAATVALEFDVGTDGDTYNRSQKQKALLSLAAQYRTKALAQTSIAGQSEMAPDYGNNPAVTYPTYTEGW